MSRVNSKHEPHESDHHKHLVERLAALGEASSTETAIFHQTAAAAYGLGITDMKALSLLVKDGPLTAGQLKTVLNLTTGAITSLIDRLEARKLAQRTADAKDRRKVIVSANFAQIAASENVYESIGKAYRKLHEKYSSAELEILVRYFETSVDITKRENLKLQTRTHKKPAQE